MNTIYIRTRSVQAALLATAVLFAAGCKREQTAVQPARTDQQITNDVQARISAESALNDQNIQVAVANGIATLSGTANDEASRALAGNDAGSVDGVKTVVNNLTVEAPKQAAAPVVATPAAEKKRKHREEKQVAEAAPPPAPVPAPEPAPPTPAGTRSRPRRPAANTSAGSRAASASNCEDGDDPDWHDRSGTDYGCTEQQGCAA
jgi:BON domain